MLLAESARETAHGFLIDPFAAAPGDISTIDGLRDGAEPADPGYAFRTLPIMPVSGPTEFAIRFSGLCADAGTLSIDLTATAAHGHGAATKVSTLVLPLAELVRAGGAAALAFDARRDTLYAVAGYVHDSASVAAHDLSVELRTLAGGVTPRPFDPAAATVEPVKSPRLASLDEPDFGDPVSQPMTAGQCRHRDFRRWADGLRAAGAERGGDLWMPAFVLQALSRYGMLRPGAQGMGLGPVDASLIAQLCAAGCVVTTHDQGLAGAFDFVWSIDPAGDAERLRDTVCRAIERLAPGGFGVHMCSLGDDAVRRSDIERLALDLISHGHQAAQLKFRQAGKHLPHGEKIPYALIWRRT